MTALPTCIIAGRIAGDSDACGDCDPCGASHAVPDVVKRLLAEKDEWREKYAEAIGRLDMQGWQPIDTAPRDGTYILIYPALLSVPCVASWQRERGWFGHFRLPMTESPAPYEPTHWMPLPAPPLPPRQGQEQP